MNGWFVIKTYAIEKYKTVSTDKLTDVKSVQKSPAPIPDNMCSGPLVVEDPT